jgi:chromosomal replication initiation ATPase DnaA
MMTKNALTMVIVLLSWMSTTACSRDIQAMTPDQIQRQYGVTGAYADTITTAEGPMKGTMVPVTLADGRQAQLFIPSQRTNEPHAVYLRDQDGIHPVQMQDSLTRDQFIQTQPSVVARRAEPAHAHKRTWEKEALIIGGSAGAGTAIGALTAGKKGAGIGAAAGGVGGLIYDLATRKH